MADEATLGAVEEQFGAEDVLASVYRIVADVVVPSADAVDQESHFPTDSIAALKQAGLLGAAVPRAFGGLGCSIPTLSLICTALARGCASTAMIVAMHYGQVHLISRHSASSDYFRRFLQAVAQKQLLVASATSEIGAPEVGTSKAAVVRTHDRVQFEKRCSVLSYAEHADAILATARRAADAVPVDQSFVLLLRGDFELEGVGVWNALGMRGTCSPPVTLHADCSLAQILPAPYREVAQRSMVPISNVLWSSVWLGIAEAAFATARGRVQARERSVSRGDVPGSRRLTRAAMTLQVMRNNVACTARECELLSSRDGSATEEDLLDQTISTNGLKVSASEMVWQVCHECLAACGVAGYMNDGPFSLGRHLRDALSGALMLGNDSVEATNAALLLLRGEAP